MEQRDQLEQFILDRRDAFDDAVPGLKAWGEINKELDRRKHKKLILWRAVGVAASVLILLMSGALMGRHYTQQQYAEAPLEKVAPQYAQLEKQYQEEINQKYAQLASFNKVGVVDQDLALLDEVMKELKEELLVAPRGKEMEIVESLLNSYQAKVAILERVLERIQPTSPNSEKGESEDEISI